MERRWAGLSWAASRWETSFCSQQKAERRKCESKPWGRDPGRTTQAWKGVKRAPKERRSKTDPGSRGTSKQEVEENVNNC